MSELFCFRCNGFIGSPEGTAGLSKCHCVADGVDAKRMTDDQIAWFIREYSQTPEHTVFKMATEIHILRRANHLLNLSRGVPSVVGAD